MKKQLFAVNTLVERSSVFVVEATSEEEAARILVEVGQSGGVLPRPALQANTSEKIIAITPTDLEELKNGLDIANTIQDSDHLVQHNVTEDELESVIVRAKESTEPASEFVAPQVFDALIRNLSNKNLH